MDRRTVEDTMHSGLELERVTDLAAGIFKLIEDRKPLAFHEQVRWGSGEQGRRVSAYSR
ncbi:MAG: hypothetical protein ACOC6A_06680 [Chloroflexota bacterium]